MKQKRNEGGFTLIELLIVIIILAILAAIVVFAVGNDREERVGGVVPVRRQIGGDRNRGLQGTNGHISGGGQLDLVDRSPDRSERLCRAVAQIGAVVDALLDQFQCQRPGLG